MTILGWLIALPLAVGAVVAGVSYAAFGWFALGGRAVLLSRVCPGRRAACVLRGLASALAAQAIMVAAYPLGPFYKARRPSGRAGNSQDGDAAPVVVCLHGLYHNPSAFWRIRWAFGRAGISRVLILGYPSFRDDFETEAARLAARLRQLMPPRAPVCFLGHSLGGLMARRLAAEPDFLGRTRCLVTLGTPHQGSALARLAVGKLGRSLTPESNLFGWLNALPDPPGARLVALASPVDNLVVPESGLVPDRPGWELELTAPVSHVAMLYAGATVSRAVALVAAGVGGGRA
ncbi:MAG TPA: alpha/beta fold hydrolase [Solidesulfovibrio magneticus]|nr:alpha/beta fold hydrolase [Solidesulfovibrio magneticus]